MPLGSMHHSHTVECWGREHATTPTWWLKNTKEASLGWTDTCGNRVLGAGNRRTAALSTRREPWRRCQQPQLTGLVDPALGWSSWLGPQGGQHPQGPRARAPGREGQHRRALPGPQEEQRDPVPGGSGSAQVRSLWPRLDLKAADHSPALHVPRQHGCSLGLLQPPGRDGRSWDMKEEQLCKGEKQSLNPWV